MTRLIIDVDEDRYTELVNYLKSLDYVNVSTEDYKVPEWQSDELKRRSQLIKNKKASYKSWKSIKEKKNPLLG